ncbi:MAG: hypothetical protein IJS45_01330 [Clostridia bacterium]|nr:hypothetical protein [Clostridia bacterium]
MSSENIELGVQNAMGKLKRYTVLGIIVHFFTGFYFMELLFDELSSRFSWGVDTSSLDLTTGLWLVQIFYFVGGMLTVFLNYKKYKSARSITAVSVVWVIVLDVIGLVIAFPLSYVPVIDLIRAGGNERLITPVILIIWLCTVLASQIIPYVVIKIKSKKRFAGNSGAKNQ